MNKLPAVINPTGIADPLASVRQYIIEDNVVKTVFKLPPGTRYTPEIMLMEFGQYKRMKYHINPMDGTTTLVTLYK